jgi:hypothetical protein
MAVAPPFRATTVPALSTDATAVSVLLQVVGAPSKAFPLASVAVTASWIVSPIEVAVSAVGVIPTQRTAAWASASVATESPSNLARIEWV